MPDFLLFIKRLKTTGFELRKVLLEALASSTSIKNINIGLPSPKMCKIVLILGVEEAYPALMACGYT
jgi:hypothetical protein